MLLEKHSHACCIPLTKLTGSLKIYDQNIFITKGKGVLLGEKAGLWGAVCGCASTAMPCAPGEPLGSPNNSSGWDCWSWVVLTHTVGSGCANTALGPLWGLIVPKPFVSKEESSEHSRREEALGLGAVGTLSLSGHGVCCMAWVGRMYRELTHCDHQGS